MASVRKSIYDRLVSGVPLHPFDPVNDRTFYSFPVDKNQVSTRRLLAQALVAAIASEVASKGVERYFCPTPMSSGLLAYKLILDDKEQQLRSSEDGLLTVQDMKHRVAAGPLMHRVVLPNRIASHMSGDRLERRFPDKGIMVVADFEAPIRETQSNHALGGGAHWQDPIFETYWGLSVYRSHGTILKGEHSFSRNGNAEEIAADFIQLGFMDAFRKDLPPGKKYPIVDEDGKAVTLSDRAWETAKHIVDVTEHGFKADFSVKALIARFQIHDWLKDPAHSPLDMSKVHSVLKGRPQAEIDRMDRLKEMMLPYLAQKCLSSLPRGGDRDCERYLEQNVLPLQKQELSIDIDALREEIFSYRPRGGAHAFLHQQYDFAVEGAGGNGALSDFSAASRKIKRRGTDGLHFADKAQIFDDKQRLFDSLSAREKAAVAFIAGAMESTRAPENAPVTWFHANHPKGGDALKSFMDKHSIGYVREAQGHKDFAKDVVAANVGRSEKADEKILSCPVAQSRGVGVMLSTRDVLDIAAVAEKHPEFVAAEGKAKLSPDAVLALEMEWADRNAQGIVLQKGWQYHQNDVQMALRAVQHALGLGPREAMEGGKHRMEIFVRDPAAKPGQELQKQSLYDLIKTLGASAEECLDSHPPVPCRELYVATARLLELVDKLADPGEMNYTREKNPQTGKVDTQEIVDWGKVDADFYGFWYNDGKKHAELSATAQGAKDVSFRDRIRDKILTRGMSFFTPEDLQGLNDEYAKSWSETQGIISRQTRGSAAQVQTLHLKHGSTS